MARKKEPVRPLLDLKHDFYASVDEVIQQGLILLQAAEFAVKYGDDIPEQIKAELDKSARAFRNSLFSEWDPSN